MSGVMVDVCFLSFSRFFLVWRIHHKSVLLFFIMLTSGGLRGALARSHFLKFIKFVNKILYFYILFYLYLYN